MKKLVSLYLSMLLICPMGAQAASVPSIIGALSWTMDSLPIYMIFTQMQCVPSFIPPEICIPYPTFGAGTITAINASVTDPQNGLPHYSLTGTASVQGGPQGSSTIPISGVMSTSGVGYIVQFNGSMGNITCTIAQSSLSGACVNTLGYPSTINFTLVTPQSITISN